MVLSVLVAGLAARPQQRRVRLPSSYLAPAPARDQEPAPSITRTLAIGPPPPPAAAAAPVSLYAGPAEERAEQTAAATSVASLAGYGDEAAAPSAPVSSLYSAPGDLARDFDYTEVNFIGDYDIQRDVDYSASVVSETVSKEYGAPQPEAAASASAVTDYTQPRAEVIASSSSPAAAVSDYSQPRADVISAAASSLASDYAQPQYGGDEAVAGSSLSARVVPAVTSPPVAILRSENTGVSDGRYRYSYEAENGISQNVEGEMKTVNDAEVFVMRGSYSYVGPDGQTYVVDWYADETGYHPSAAHLPRSVEPNHPEVAEAVRAQLAAAAEEEAAAASTNSLVIAAPDSDYEDIFGDDLAGYGYK